MISTSTMYRKRTETIGNEIAAIQVLLQDEKKCRLHWVDNYARFVKGNCLWYNQDVLKQLRWTAHGFKSLSFDIPMTWKLDTKNDPIVAMPPLKVLLSAVAVNSLHAELSVISPFQFERSLVVLKNVLRVPLKSPLPADESLVDGHPADGLHIFYPIDLYQDNIVSTEGLLAVFGRLQSWRGMASMDIVVRGCIRLFMLMSQSGGIFSE